MSGIQRIQVERFRQIDSEGYSEEHDDDHDDGALAMAAASYCVAEDMRNNRCDEDFPPALLWPWKDEDWKPSPDDRIKELVKAGALIVAEIERLERKKLAHEDAKRWLIDRAKSNEGK